MRSFLKLAFIGPVAFFNRKYKVIVEQRTLVETEAGRPKYVRQGNVINSAGAPQGTVFAPFLFTTVNLYTSNFIFNPPTYINNLL